MRAAIFDTETTDKNAPEIVEASYAEFTLDNGKGKIGKPVTQRFMPAGEITMGALATHGIFKEDLAGCPPAADFRLPSTVEFIIGHNIDFDWNAAGSPEHLKRIDTCALARRLFPECDTYSVGALSYYLFGRKAKDMLKEAHSAEPDVLNTGRILEEILKIAPAQTLEDLWELSEVCRIPVKMPFGKHQDMDMMDVPQDYKDWYNKQADKDPYVLAGMRGEGRVLPSWAKPRVTKSQAADAEPTKAEPAVAVEKPAAAAEPAKSPAPRKLFR